MKDDNDNECYYDFKNIMFAVGARSRSGIISNVYYYTFSVATGTNDSSVTDHSLNKSYCYKNSIGKYINFYSKLTLSFNLFRNISNFHNCHNNTFGNSCYNNTFGNGCYNNILRNHCYSNTFGSEVGNNIFGNYCFNNNFGNGCYRNTFGNYCYSNTFGHYSSSNILGNNCESNILGNNCDFNTFGNYCKSIIFGFSNIIKNFYKYIIIENGNTYIYLNCLIETSDSNNLQNIKIAQGVNNTNNLKTITHPTLGDNFQTEYKSANSQTVLV